MLGHSANIKLLANNANAFASIYAFLPTHNAMQKKAKELASQSSGHNGHQCKLDMTALLTKRKAADNSRFKKFGASVVKRSIV
jgi:hypothetical protein